MYKSNAQRKFFNANRGKMEAQGVDVDEYNEASKGAKLPERAPSHHGRITMGQRIMAARDKKKGK